MRSAIARVTIKIIELLGCIACFVTKVITDLEARRVFLRNQKYSREWSLLHNVTWSSAGNTFANITYGGFSLITTMMLVSRCIDANSRPSIIEKIFLVVGMLCFFAMGGLVLAAFDQVPWELHDNSIILGCLSFFVALVMLYDLADPIARHVTDTTQTDNEYTMPQQQQPPQQQQQQQQQQPQQPPPQQQAGAVLDVSQANPSTNNQSNQSNSPAPNQANGMTQVDMADKSVQYQKPIAEKVFTQTQTVQTSIEPSMRDDIAQNGNYHRGDTIDFVQYQHMPHPEQPVFERVLLPEKKRPTYNKVADPHNPHNKATIVQNIRTDDYVPRETHFDSTIHYNQMPKYAAIQRQPATTHQNHDYPSSYAPPPTPMYKLNRNYEPNDYERPPTKRTIINDYGRPPPKHTSIKTMRSDELSRYHDAATEHYQNQPMMVIRNYGHTTTQARPSTVTPTVHSIPERRHQQSNESGYHRNGNNGTRKSATHITQMNTRKNGCCHPNPDDDVDFRKMNHQPSAIRPGFVASVAKMWDKRAVENSGEFNTIV